MLQRDCIMIKAVNHNLTRFYSKDCMTTMDLPASYFLVEPIHSMNKTWTEVVFGTS